MMIEISYRAVQPDSLISWRAVQFTLVVKLAREHEIATEQLRV